MRIRRGQSRPWTAPLPPPTTASSSDSRWLGPRATTLVDLVLIVAAVLAAHVWRISDLTIRGEEPRRATVAREMIETGDWIVPRQQGTLFLSRPPLQNWLIAISAKLAGGFNNISVRLPGVLAVLATALVLYGVSRQFFANIGALAAAISYITMIQVLELGQLAETETLFTLFVSGSLLLWIAGYAGRWHPAMTWCVAYTLVGLGTLTKGPQAPVYFGAAIGAYLLVARDWRFAFTRWHVLGITVAAGIVAAWQIPYTMSVGWDATRHIYQGDVAMRFEDTRWSTIFEHLAIYPVEVIICTCPWSLLLLAYIHRGLWQSLGRARPLVVFAWVAIAVTFPSCWLVPGARGRYYMPLYPCLTVLAGAVVAQCSVQRPALFWQYAWRRYLLGAVVLAPVLGVVVLGFSLRGGSIKNYLVQTPEFAAMFLCCTVVAAVVCWLAARQGFRFGAYAGVLSIAAVAIVAWRGAVLNNYVRRQVDTAGVVARLQSTLPTGARLVAFEDRDLLQVQFAYHYPRTVPLVPEPASAETVSGDWTYFCVNEAWAGAGLPDMPFACEVVAVIPCGRHADRKPATAGVVVGRRITEQAARGATAPATPIGQH
ncbi:MAG: glycosyltransferase family 39 protein [Pirellulales bacterium]|nr:glycosyltransferase family 39 protein [Pirellulales bacterium]